MLSLPYVNHVASSILITPHFPISPFRLWPWEANHNGNCRGDGHLAYRTRSMVKNTCGKLLMSTVTAEEGPVAVNSRSGVQAVSDKSHSTTPDIRLQPPSPNAMTKGRYPIGRSPGCGNQSPADLPRPKSRDCRLGWMAVVRDLDRDSISARDLPGGRVHISNPVAASMVVPAGARGRAVSERLFGTS